MIPNNSSAINPISHRAGTVLSTSRFLYRHLGILTGRFINGFPTVISNSGDGGMVIEESLSQFQGTGDLQVVGYLGTLPQDVVLARAQAKLGSKYSLLTWNCEHFVRHAHGLKQESPQVVAAVSLFALLLVVSRL
ncbi:MAG: lecithin retinol acyltransferase family protein [Candidatus Pacebacteria bacterium]|jgi:hypothetical protein|nr:lecithin retinol acyltransferase family protein [Candidatus Paceibacterota bacterium]